MYNRILNGKDGIKNYAKAANRRLNMEMGVNHESLWAFITYFQKVQAGRDFYYTSSSWLEKCSQLEAENNPTKKIKKKYYCR